MKFLKRAKIPEAKIIRDENVRFDGMLEKNLDRPEKIELRVIGLRLLFHTPPETKYVKSLIFCIGNSE